MDRVDIMIIKVLPVLWLLGPGLEAVSGVVSVQQMAFGAVVPHERSLVDNRDSSSYETLTYPLLDPGSGQVLAEVIATTSQRGLGADRSLEKSMVYRRVSTPSAGPAENVVETLVQDPAGLLLSYRYFDPKTGEKLQVVVDKGTAQITSSAAHDDISTTLSLPWTAESLVGAQITDYILKHWSTIESGRTLKFELFVPFRRGFFTFLAQKSRPNPKASVTKGVTHVQVVANSWMIRAFAPSISLDFQCFPSGGTEGCRGNQDRLKLVAYQGPSPLEIKGERHPTIKLDLVLGSLTPKS